MNCVAVPEVARQEAMSMAVPSGRWRMPEHPDSKLRWQPRGPDVECPQPKSQAHRISIASVEQVGATISI